MSAPAVRLHASPPPGEAPLSATGRLWRTPAPPAGLAARLSACTGVSSLVASVLAARGVSADSAPAFLAPKLKTVLPDPSVMADMDAAATRIADAVERGERIAIFGDYDVDGVTASALLARTLKELGADVRVRLPDRELDGYGPSVAAFRALAEEGATLILTADCGASAVEPVAAAAAAGADVVVLDHHQMGGERPAAAAIVNPNRPDCPSGLRELSAAGVSLMAMIAATRELRRRGRFAARAEPNLVGKLDLAALGLICDVMPMTGAARAIAAQGLKVMAMGATPGMAELVARVGDRRPLTAYDAGFVIGPRINAAGRLANPKIAFDLLMTDDPDEARRLAVRLDELNAERRAIEQAVTDAAAAEIGEAADAPVVVAAGEGWREGVVGISAGRLREKFGRPAFAIAIRNGVGKGSGRSVPGVDIGAAVRAAVEAGVLIAGGGHAQAAGLTVAPERVGDLRDFLGAHIRDQAPDGAPVEELSIDAEARLGAISGETAEALSKLGPFGPGNPEPTLVFRGVRIDRLDVRGGRHFALSLSGEIGEPAARAVVFRADGSDLGAFLAASVGRRVDLAGVVRADTWRGGGAGELHVQDARAAR